MTDYELMTIDLLDQIRNSLLRIEQVITQAPPDRLPVPQPPPPPPKPLTPRERIINEIRSRK